MGKIIGKITPDMLKSNPGRLQGVKDLNRKSSDVNINLPYTNPQQYPKMHCIILDAQKGLVFFEEINKVLHTDSGTTMNVNPGDKERLKDKPKIQIDYPSNTYAKLIVDQYRKKNKIEMQELGQRDIVHAVGDIFYPHAKAFLSAPKKNIFDLQRERIFKQQKNQAENSVKIMRDILEAKKKH